jgi:Uma2 family endonuclease
MVITASPFVKTYTLEEFWKLPKPPGVSKLELIKGVLYMSPPPKDPHSDIVANLIALLGDFIRDHRYRGKVYVPDAAIWVEDTYLEPDLMYISDKLRSEFEPHHWTRAELVIEVASLSTEQYDRTAKADTYEALGVDELWLVYAETKTVEVRSFKASKRTIYQLGDSIRSEVLTELRLGVDHIFPR